MTSIRRSCLAVRFIRGERAATFEVLGAVARGEGGVASAISLERNVERASGSGWATGFAITVMSSSIGRRSPTSPVTADHGGTFAPPALRLFIAQTVEGADTVR